MFLAGPPRQDQQQLPNTTTFVDFGRTTVGRPTEMPGGLEMSVKNGGVPQNESFRMENP